MKYILRPTPPPCRVESVGVLVRERRKKYLRGILLFLNTLTLAASAVKIAMSIHMIMWASDMFWWGIGSLQLGTFAALVASIYYPLIWNSVRLAAVKIVLICMTISNFADGGFTLYQILRTEHNRDHVQYRLFAATKGLHLGVMFSSFTYYWRLYNIALLEASQVDFRNLFR